MHQDDGGVRAIPGDVAIPQSAPLDHVLHQGQGTIRVRVVDNPKGDTLLVGVKDILPEDVLWRRDHPNVPAVVCFEEERACQCPWGCIPKLAQRCHWLFDMFPNARQLLILFKRGEKDIRRKLPELPPIDARAFPSVSRSMARQDVPRILVLHVPTDFGIRLFRANYDGLQLVLEASQVCELSPPVGLF